MIRFKLPGNSKSKFILLIILVCVAILIFIFEHNKTSSNFSLPSENNTETISPK